jgi:hypothetical protein
MQPYKQPKSPELVKRIHASAEKYRDLTNQLGLAFRVAQQESYEGWCAWEREAD